MKYTVYKIINLVNNKIYIGVHKTSNLNDGYMGSGKNIRRAIKKYGLENFKKVYLAIFDNEDEMFEMESKIVNEDFIKNLETYNIVKGGSGGFEYINKNIWTSEKRKKQTSDAGKWCDLSKRQKVWKSTPIEFRKENAKKMGEKFGGQNKLNEKEIKDRLILIENIDLTKYGWVQKVSELLDITHTQTKRFIEKHYNGDYYRRKNKMGL